MTARRTRSRHRTCSLIDMAEGRIQKALSGFYYVDTGTEILTCRARGKFRKEGVSPLVGDWVEVRELGGGEGFVEAIRPRRNAFARPAVANIDQLVIIASGAIPRTDPFLIDRVAAIAALKDCDVIVLLNKCDLDPAFHLQVGEVSDALGRGRHTTRHVELYHLSCGGDIVDSPGFSSFETDELNLELKHRLPETFREFAPYLGACRFVGCSHTKEKGCAVLEALRAGKLQPSRHASYVRLFEELKPLQDWQEKKK